MKGKDWTGAIEQFERAVDTFDSLYQKGEWEEEDLEYFVTIRYRSMMERAHSFFAIAQESNAAKRHIFLEYAQEAYRAVLADFEQADHPLTGLLHRGEAYPRLLEESEHGLAHTLVVR